MCGIFGYSGHRPVDLVKLRWLAVENQARGSDSTGIYANHLYKDKVRAKDFIQTAAFKAAAKGAHTVQGHTRAASYGYAVTKDNAHPFMFGKDEEFMCVGAHNGFVIPEMIPHHLEDFGFEKEFPVDSMLIFATLNKYKGDLDMISKIEGALAISFTFPNIDKDILYLYKRQNTRVLHMGEASDGIYYSSEDYPLAYIGCDTIWAAQPNTIYTLKRGKIIDMYKLPDPVLKTMASNVKRVDWKSGIPDAQLSALPVNVGIPTGQNASKGKIHIGPQTSYDTKQMGLYPKDGSLRRMATEIDPNRDAFTDKYSTKNSSDSIKSQYQLLIRNIQAEMMAMNAVDLPNVVSSNRDTTHDYSNAIIAITLKNGSNGKGLCAWSVLTENNTEVSGLTTPNGYTVLKVPLAMCNKEIKLHVYDPIDRLGHYVFTVVPLASRVMEVALSIPFRESGDEKKNTTFNPSKMDNGESTDREGGTGCPLYVSELNGIGNNVNDKRGHYSVVRKKGGQISGGHQRQQAIGSKAESRDTIITLPENSQKVESILRTKYKYLLPTYEDKDKRDDIIDMLIEIDVKGNYTCSWKPDTKLWSKFINSEGYIKWWFIYNNPVVSSVLDNKELLSDALRLLVWDRQHQHCNYNIDWYIELLLQVRSKYYIKISALKTHPYLTGESLIPKKLENTEVIMGLTPDTKKKEKMSS